MRILHVIQELGVGGAERAMLLLIEGAGAAGATLAVAASPGPLSDELEIPRFDLPMLGRRAWMVPRGIVALRGAVRTFRPDLLHCHNPGMAVLGAAVTARGRAIPGVVTVQGVPERDYPATARLLRLAGLEVAACGPGVAAALGEAGLRGVVTIPNAIGATPEPIDRAALREAWRVPPAHRLIISVGRLVEQKNHELALRAMRGIPDVTLAIVGEGPLRTHLETLARSFGVADRVLLVGMQRDARRLLPAADVCVLPSVWEGLPLVGLEAAAAGTPLVATDVRGIREVFRNGTNALLVSVDDPDALARAVRRVLSDGALALRLRTAGRELGAEYGKERMVAAYLDLYRSLLKR